MTDDVERKETGLPPLEEAIGRIHWAKAQVQSARDRLNDAIQEMIDAEQVLIDLRKPASISKGTAND